MCRLMTGTPSLEGNLELQESVGSGGGRGERGEREKRESKMEEKHKNERKGGEGEWHVRLQEGKHSTRTSLHVVNSGGSLVVCGG